MDRRFVPCRTSQNVSAEKTMAKAATEKRAGTKDAAKRKPNPALMKPLQPSKELAAVVGSDPLPRPEMVSRVWDYIRKNNLQKPRPYRFLMLKCGAYPAGQAHHP